MCETIKLMLRFQETERPSFVEIGSIALVVVADINAIGDKDRDSLI